MRLTVITARPAPFMILGITAGVALASLVWAGDDVRLSPGRVSFSMKANGEWTGFGVRGERALIEKGGVVIFAQRPGNVAVDEYASAADGDMKGVHSTGDDVSLFEGVRGGVRYPSFQPDDDNDGRIDEDAWDKVDNDADGQVDEDFAVAGDEMGVAIYGSRGDAPVAVRQECYAWSLPHIDGMVASTIVVTNTGTGAIPGARVGIDLEAANGLDLASAPRIEASRHTNDIDAAFAEHHIVFGGARGGLAVLLLVSREALRAPADGSGVAWEIQADRNRVVAASPDLGDLEPGESVTLYVALVALSSDDLKAARAIRNAHRTVVGDAKARMLPPPVSLVARGDDMGSPRDGVSPPAGGVDPFWTTAGRLSETLLVGSPNPFHDAISIDYEIPSRVTDEDGVEHVLVESGHPTSVKVYNVAGRLVATLVDQPHAPGRYRTEWVARNQDGVTVASGVYYVKLEIGRRSVTMRMVQLK